MRLFFVVNPSAGRLDIERLRARLRREFAGFDTEICSDPALLRPASDDLVVVVGGDGTVHRVLQSLAGFDVPLGILPCGTANDLARALGIPSSFSRACGVIRDGASARFDLVRVAGGWFATGGGVGLIASVGARVHRWKSGRGAWWARRLGTLVYLLAAIREIAWGWEPVFARIEPGGHRIDAGAHVALRGVFAAILISKQGRLGRWFAPSPGASPCDGLLHVCAIRSPRRRLRMLWICMQVSFGRAARCPEVVELCAHALTIRTASATLFHGDGEGITRDRLFELYVVPDALPILVSRRGVAAEARHAG
jgi:diacylglycerol kinase (ATP)